MDNNRTSQKVIGTVMKHQLTRGANNSTKRIKRSDSSEATGVGAPLNKTTTIQKGVFEKDSYHSIIMGGRKYYKRTDNTVCHPFHDTNSLERRIIIGPIVGQSSIATNHQHLFGESPLVCQNDESYSITRQKHDSANMRTRRNKFYTSTGESVKKRRRFFGRTNVVRIEMKYLRRMLTKPFLCWKRKEAFVRPKEGVLV